MRELFKKKGPALGREGRGLFVFNVGRWAGGVMVGFASPAINTSQKIQEHGNGTQSLTQPF